MEMIFCLFILSHSFIARVCSCGMVVHGTQGEVGGPHEGVGLFSPLFRKSQGLNLGCQARCQRECLDLMSHLAGLRLCAGSF